MRLEINIFPYMTNLYCEENNKFQDQGNRLVYTKKFLSVRIPQRFLILGKQNWQTQISDRRKQLWEDDILKLKEELILCFHYLFCKNIPHFTGIACWEHKGSIVGKVWSPEKVYNKGHRYSLEALQLSKCLQTRHHNENFSMHFSRGHLGQRSSGIRQDEVFTSHPELLDYLPSEQQSI